MKWPAPEAERAAEQQLMGKMRMARGKRAQRPVRGPGDSATLQIQYLGFIELLGYFVTVRLLPCSCEKGSRRVPKTKGSSTWRASCAMQLLL